MSKFIKTIKNYLHQNAITQTELAEYLGISRQHLNNYLQGDFDSINLELKCKEFMQYGEKIK